VPDSGNLILTCTAWRIPTYLLVIPFPWGLFGAVTISIGIVEGVGMLPGALMATAMIMHRD
jgi:ABC-type uncharacterized transport system permease subunit